MEQNKPTDKYKDKILTIPNILSFVRILLIPLIIWLYLGPKSYVATSIVVIISGLTDVVDGFVARKFNMISDVGKVLDPFADKATQLVVIILLATRFPLMIMPIVLTLIKESFMALTGYLVIKKCDIVLGAHWHGKLATAVLTATMVLHLVWYDIIPVLSNVMICVSGALILLSLTLYAKRNFGYLLGKTKTE